jgi:hypothetical protein
LSRKLPPQLRVAELASLALDLRHRLREHDQRVGVAFLTGIRFADSAIDRCPFLSVLGLARDLARLLQDGDG